MEKLDSMSCLFVPELLYELENMLINNIIDHKIQINGNTIITAVEVPLSLKNPPGYVAIIQVIIIKNIIKKILPYVENDEKCSNTLLLVERFA